MSCPASRKYQRHPCLDNKARVILAMNQIHSSCILDLSRWIYPCMGFRSVTVIVLVVINIVIIHRQIVKRFMPAYHVRCNQSTLMPCSTPDLCIHGSE